MALFSTRFRVASAETWHRQLCHPQAVVVDKLRQLGFIKVHGKDTTTICESCQLSKSSRLPFVPSSNKTSAAFEKNHVYKIYFIICNN